jgi:hypothetical protein
MAEIKKQKADKTGADSAFMSVDSPQTVTMTDLDTLGMTSVMFQQGFSVGGGGGGAVDTSAAPSADQYYALCNTVFHPPEMPGAQPNGVWLGFARDTAEEAFFDAGTHEDGGAVVMYRVGSVIVGPVTNPF